MSPLENLMLGSTSISMCPTTMSSSSSSRLEAISSINISTQSSSSTITADDSSSSNTGSNIGSKLPTTLSCPRIPVVSSNQQQQQKHMSRLSSMIQKNTSSSNNSPIRVESGSNVQRKGILPLMKKVSSNVIQQVCDIDERVCIYCQIRGKMIEDWKNGDRICTNCGIVDEEKISDTTPEWRDYDNDDRAGGNDATNNARCGLQITDETKYWGGLQPTTVSKYIYGGVVTSKNTKRTSSYDTGTALRKSVSMANYRVQYRIEQIQKQQLIDAKLSYKLRQKLIQTSEKNKDRTRRSSSSSNKTKRRRQDTDDDDDDTHNDEYRRHNDDGNKNDVDNDDTDDDNASCYDQNSDDIADTSRPELEYLVVVEEEDAYKLQIAINSDKWSLDRAIHLYGDSSSKNPTNASSSVLTFNEVLDFDDNDSTNNNDLLVDKNGNYKEVTGKVKKINKELRTASYELYIVYTILVSSSLKLQLPTTVTNEAIALLCKYIQYHDGIIVRGISTTSIGSGAKSTLSTYKASDKQQQQQKRLQPTSLNRNSGINSNSNNNERTKRIVLNHHHNQRCLKRKLSNCSSSSYQVVNDSTITVMNDKQNKILYKEYNLIKQMGALCSGILYLISRSMQYPRTIDEVCQSITIPQSFIEKYKDKIQQEQELQEDVSQKCSTRTTASETTITNTSFIIRKHCSCAMKQIKSCFPDFARITTSGSHTILVNQNNNSNNSSNDRHNNNEVMTSFIPTSDTDITTTTIDNYDSVCNFIEHTIRKLLLPPVAQASIRCLVYVCRNRSTSMMNENNANNNYNDSNNIPFPSINTEHFASTKLPTVCAAITYFTCIVGTTMRTLAVQAEVDAAKEKKRKAGASVVPVHNTVPATTSSRSLSATAKSSSSSSTSNTLFDWKSKYSAVNVSTKQQQTERKEPAVKVVEGTVPCVLGGQQPQQAQQQQQKQEEEEQQQPFDVFATNVDITMIDAEHRAYGMRRMWDAWIEQMEWNRTIVEIEKVTNVSQKVIRDYYKQHIYPIRQQLLEILQKSVVTVTADVDTVSSSVNNATKVVINNSNGLFPEQIELKDTPLASLLLSHITAATSTMKSK